jgi:alkylation response protein AidB-like acyl-CoA dehydrogenase
MNQGEPSWIRSPADPRFDELCGRLETEADRLDQTGKWPAEQLAWCAEFGVWSWFIPAHYGGQEWSERDVLAAYLKLGKACLTTTFIATQWSAATRRIMACHNADLKQQLAPGLLGGELFTTVGISHLTTSRRHLARPVLAAWAEQDGYLLDGFSPWVTGGAYADLIVTGATLADGRQILAAVPTNLPGVQPQEPLRLVGLSASATGQVDFRQVRIRREQVLVGPVENVFAVAAGAQTGGLQTSALALACSRASLDYLEGEADPRPDLRQPTAELAHERAQLESDLMRLAAGEAVCTADELRARANSLALRASQAALAAAKGSGYVVGHRAARLCREALFFLVWSCPQGVMLANLCELAGLGD